MYRVQSLPLLKRILWIDALLGSATGLVGLTLSAQVSRLLGLPLYIVLIIATVTLFYALLALSLARSSTPPADRLRLLIYANAVWAVISLLLFAFYLGEATWLGRSFLSLQILVVGALAAAESRHLCCLQRNQP